MSGIDLSGENRAWLAAFTAARGRAPRMLHIGNIANNAYNNAKLLNAAGLDCDVICYDYYHVMGCPEWEDADFEGEIADHFHPDWNSVTLNGFRRPDWFAQGPLDQCIDYLYARRTGNTARARMVWMHLELTNRTRRSREEDHPAMFMPRARAQYLRARRILGVLADEPHLLSRIDARYDVFRGESSARQGIGVLAVALPVVLLALVIRLITLPARLRRVQPDQLTDRIARLTHEFGSAFPDRRDQLSDAELRCYRPSISMWEHLLKQYDIIQAYSTDPIIPLLAGRDCFAFEHGTLRDIPFADTPQGRMTAIAYRLASHVFVTNFDCLDNARLLAGGRVTLINHPYDEEHGVAVTGWERLRSQLQEELKASFIFFFPTRHDWVPGTGYADKANDIFLRAFAALRRRNPTVGVVCCRWGANVRESERLIEQLGCGAHVKWVSPMAITRFERMARASHCVVDQFKLGSFGGVMFKAMAVGAPICTYLDEPRFRRQYPEMPPVINCRSESEIVERFSPLIEAPDDLARLGVECRDWMKRHHSRAMVVNAQIDQYRQCTFPGPRQ